MPNAKSAQHGRDGFEILRPEASDEDQTGASEDWSGSGNLFRAVAVQAICRFSSGSPVRVRQKDVLLINDYQYLLGCLVWPNSGKGTFLRHLGSLVLDSHLKGFSVEKSSSAGRVRRK